MALASKTAISEAELQQIKALYTQLWRQKTGSMRDPFDELDKNAAMDLDFEALPLNGK
jgi:nucleoporin p58/p45